MSIDRKYIFDKVVFFLKKETKFFTSSELHMIIGVDAFRRVARDTGFPKSNYSSVMASGVWSVDMPSDFIKVDDTKDLVFKDGVGLHGLGHKKQKDIGRVNILTASPSSPYNFFMEDENTLGVYPPSTSGIVVVPYVKIPTSLSNDTATNEITERCYMAGVYWTVSECMLKDNDMRYQVYIGRYNKEVQELRGTYGELFDGDESIVPAEDYLRR